jgi:hypothetical protein
MGWVPGVVSCDNVVGGAVCSRAAHPLSAAVFAPGAVVLLQVVPLLLQVPGAVAPGAVKLCGRCAQSCTPLNVRRSSAVRQRWMCTAGTALLRSSVETCVHWVRLDHWVTQPIVRWSVGTFGLIRLQTGGVGGMVVLRSMALVISTYRALLLRF